VTPPTVGDAGEHALIARLRARFAPAGDGNGLLLGIGDDAAVIAPERNTFDVVTTDALVEGVHFDRRWMSAADIGHKAVAVNPATWARWAPTAAPAGVAGAAP
jgi:thiamine-monophosphate kinase